MRSDTANCLFTNTVKFAYWCVQVEIWRELTPVVPNVIKKILNLKKKKKVWGAFNKSQASEKWWKRFEVTASFSTDVWHLLTENVSSLIHKLRTFSFETIKLNGDLM